MSIVLRALGIGYNRIKPINLLCRFIWVCVDSIIKVASKLLFSARKDATALYETISLPEGMSGRRSELYGVCVEDVGILFFVGSCDPAVHLQHKNTASHQH